MCCVVVWSCGLEVLVLFVVRLHGSPVLVVVVGQRLSAVCGLGVDLVLSCVSSGCCRGVSRVGCMARSGARWPRCVMFVFGLVRPLVWVLARRRVCLLRFGMLVFALV